MLVQGGRLEAEEHVPMSSISGIRARSPLPAGRWADQGSGHLSMAARGERTHASAGSRRCEDLAERVPGSPAHAHGIRASSVPDPVSWVPGRGTGILLGLVAWLLTRSEQNRLCPGLLLAFSAILGYPSGSYLPLLQGVLGGRAGRLPPNPLTEGRWGCVSHPG